MLGAHPSMTEARVRPVGVPSTTPGRSCGFEGALTSQAGSVYDVVYMYATVKVHFQETTGLRNSG
jgi:hypothetical protein